MRAGPKISIEQILEQVGLPRADLLAALDKPVPLEDGDLCGQLFDDGYRGGSSAHGVDLWNQLRSECAQLAGSYLGFYLANRLQQ